MPTRAVLPKVCVALGIPNADDLLAQARHEIQEGDRFLELRLDALSNPAGGIAVIRALCAESPDVSVLATCRRKENHGGFAGSIDQQIQLLSEAIGAGARAVDLEIESAEVRGVSLDGLHKARFIVSYHNWEMTPATEPIVRRLSRIPADCYKLVTTAKKPSDIGRVLNAIKPAARSKWVLLAMGEVGFPARILGPPLGTSYTYAAPSNTSGTAPGQVSSYTLRHLYRIEKLTKSAKIYGVIADPVRHSISPAVHNRAFQARRIDAVYVPFLTAPAQLRDFMQLCDKLPVSGFSVTIPHKQKIIRYLDVVDPLARRIGAVNTVWKKAGKWRGANTDIFGVTGPLSRRIKLAKAKVLVVGTGGAARGAAFALVDAGATVSIAGRSLDKVKSLARITGATSLACEQLEKEHFDAIVHATPVGMHPNEDACFFEDRIPGDLVFDMVYNPAKTLLLKRAEEQRRAIIPGLEMFLEQAAHQFEIFTGESAPRDAMEKAAIEALALG